MPMPKDVKKLLDAKISETVKTEVGKSLTRAMRNLPAANTNTENAKVSAGKAYAGHLVAAVDKVAPQITSKAKAYTTAAGAGGEFAPAIQLETFIGILAEEAIVVGLGADTSAQGYGSSVQVARLDDVGDGAWLPEGSSGTAEDGDTSFLTLHARRFQIRGKISDRVLNQPGSMMLEGATDSLLRRVAEKVDYAFINGGGANGPVGIIPSMTAGQSVPASAAGATATAEELEAMLLAAKARVESANVKDHHTSAWLMSPNTYNKLCAKRDAVGNRVFDTLVDSGTLYGVQVKKTNNVDDGTVLFGRFDMVAVGIAEPAQFQAAKLGDDAVADVTSVWSKYIGDCALKHGKAFAAITDIDDVL